MDTLEHVINRIYEVTEQLVKDATHARWEAFFEHAQQRAILLEKFQQLTQTLHPQLESDTDNDLNHWIQNEFRKVAKVDREIGDIIDKKREELITKILETRKGQRFLKNYKNKVNFERIVSRVY